MGASRGGSYDHERFRRQLEREAAREQSQRERDAQKVAKEQYLRSRQEEAVTRTEQAGRARAALDELLVRALAEPVRQLDLHALRCPAPSVTLDLGADAAPTERPQWADFVPAPPGRFGRMLGGQARYENATTQARHRFERAVAAHAELETARLHRVAAARQRHAERQADADRRTEEANAAIDRLVDGVGRVNGTL